jgi:microcin C transport system ATP-binding protein
MSLVTVEDLTVSFGKRVVVDRVTFTLDRGETLALVGESGSGKSLTALSLLQLLPPGGVAAGRVVVDGQSVIGAGDGLLRRLRGGVAGMVFQEPMTSLNPLARIGRQIAESVHLHQKMSPAAARARVVKLLCEVGFPDASHRLDAFPHQLSGGQRQRVMIAMALANDPALLIADEPTTALDVTIQAQILHLIKELQRKTGAAVLFITHDMGVVAEMCDEVAVMYAGRIVEQGEIHDIFKRSRHPYTKGLLRSLPQKGAAKKVELPTIEGVVPSLLNPPPYCRFADRCWKRKRLSEELQKKCFTEDPALRPFENGLVACHYPVPGEEP